MNTDPDHSWHGTQLLEQDRLYLDLDTAGRAALRERALHGSGIVILRGLPLESLSDCACG